MNRRALLTACSAALLAGCGFTLRRPLEFKFSTVQLLGFKDRSPLAEELQRNIDASASTKVVESDAQVILEALNDVRDKSVVATTAAGLVREVRVSVRLNFRLRTPTGKELIAPSEIVLSRDMSFNEGAALGKEYEAALIYRAMQSDIVSQVMHRLAAVQTL